MTYRVYLPSGGVSHVLPWNATPLDPGVQALCKRSAWPGVWHGTGGAKERQKAAELPLCVSCRDAARKAA